MPERDETAIRDVIARWERLFNDSDFDALEAVYADDAWVYTPDGSVVRGPRPIRDSISGFGGSAKISIDVDDVRVAGDDAYAFGSYRFTTPDGAPMFGGNNVTTFRRVGGEWKFFRYLAAVTAPQGAGGNG